MRNLKVSSSLKLSVPDLNCEFVTGGSAITTHDTKTLQRNLYIFQDDKLLLINARQGILSSCSVANLFPDKPPPVKGMLYVDLFDVLYTFHETGEVLLFSTNPGSSSLNVEHFSFFDSKIVAIEWSPDKEIGVYITAENKLKIIVLTASGIDSLSEYDMFDTASGEKELINVGWGKKETQFHGMEGKKAALSKGVSYPDDPLVCDKSVSISWRGDSTMFAVGYWCETSRKRRIKFFSKDGTLLCINEDISGLEGVMSWKPQGNLLAITQHLPNKYVVAFFEKNGLKHLDFELPNDFIVKQLTWNIDSNILCSLMEHKESKRMNVMLWTTGNYHWYLKQNFPIDFEVVKILWDEDRENKLYMIGKNGTIFDVELSWNINHSNYPVTANKYFVSVIDNEKILLTPFHAAIIPPPMCKWTLKCPTSVSKILFPPFNYDSSKECKYFMCALLSDRRFCFFTENFGEPVISRIDSSLMQELPGEAIMFHWEWVSSTCLCCVSIFLDNSCSVLNISLDEEKMIIQNKIILEELVIATSVRNSNLLIFVQDGRFIEYNTEKNCLGMAESCFPEPCYHVVGHLEYIYGLSEWNRLYKNGQLISYNVTSFLVHDPFILATTSNHTLRILKCDSTEECEEVSIRKLERGSKLVASTGNTVVMQMPRGNLETIQPRALTVMSAGKLLDKKYYKECIQLLRRQRICFDLCIDHNSQEFFTNINHFIQTVHPQWITLLITELTPTDVTRGIYARYYNQERESSYTDQEKISKVCGELLKSLLNVEDQESYMLPILSCLVKTKAIGKAIELANNEQALQHLLFLVDVDTLYNEALGAYNLEAALKIAGKSQMDPKEYVPYLNSLKQMDINYMKYEIDKMLKKHSSALVNLSKCNDDKLDDIIYALIEDNQLYNLALKLFSNQPERFTKTALMYGEFLYKKTRYEESGIMFVRGNNLEKAITAFTRSGNWRQCMLLAKRCNYSENHLRSIGDSVCNVLISLQKFNEAAAIYKDCFTDFNRTIDIYLLGRLWNEAIYLAECSGMQNLLQTTIKKSVLDAADMLTEEVNNTKTKFVGYKERLKKVRIEKLNKPKFKDFDEMSDAGSTISKSNQSSVSKTSRMTKKMNRKLWSLKEGNPREEEALLATLSQLMVNADKIIDEVKHICSILLHLNEDEKARTLQNNVKSYLNIMDKAKFEIWPKDPNEDETAILDLKYKYPPELNIDSRWEFALLLEEESV